MHFQRFANPSIEKCFLFRMSYNVGNGTEFKHIVHFVCHIMLATEQNLEYIYMVNNNIYGLFHTLMVYSFV